MARWKAPWRTPAVAGDCASPGRSPTRRRRCGGASPEPGPLKQGFPQRFSGGWGVGGVVTFHKDLTPDFHGEVLAYAPPSLLEFRWGTDVIRLEIEERDGGCTL